MGDDHSQAGEPVDGLDIGTCVLDKFQTGTGVCDSLTGREGCSPTVVDSYHIRCHRGQLVAVERGVTIHNDIPRARGRFAGYVARVELSDGGVEVVELEHDACHGSVVVVDLDDCERRTLEPLGWLVLACGEKEEAEGLFPGSDHGCID